jgi:hypothetical protein
MIGMPIGSGSIPWPTAVSLMSTVRACDKADIPVRISAPTGSSMVLWARSSIVGKFLTSDCTHLFWIDADLAWTSADFFRVLGFGAIYDLISGAYMLKTEPARCVVNVPNPDEYEVDGHGNIRIKSIAMGFTLCKREVIEKIAATKPMVRDDLSKATYPDFFRVDRRPDGGLIGEDIAFFDDATALGYKAWLDPSIKLEHIGVKAYKGDVIDALGLNDYAQEKQECPTLPLHTTKQ